jgi:hypothetical protein
MSRIKFVLIVVVLFVIAIGVLPASAASPNPATCQYNCYASNYGSANGNGTLNQGQLWYYNSVTDPDAVSLRTLMRNAVMTQHPAGGTLTVYKCTSGQATTCPGVKYAYTANGTETATQLGNLPIPTTGVPVPASYLLLGGVALAAVLLSVGLALRARARRVAA